MNGFKVNKTHGGNTIRFFETNFDRGQPEKNNSHRELYSVAKYLQLQYFSCGVMRMQYQGLNFCDLYVLVFVEVIEKKFQLNEHLQHN